MTRALIIGDAGSVRWIITHEHGVAIGPTATAFDALLNGPGRDESGFLAEQIGSQSTQRCNIVNDPNPASVCCQNEIVFAWLDGEIAYGHGGKVVALELGPAFSAIDRDVEAKLGSEKKKVRLNNVFLDYVCVY